MQLHRMAALLASAMLFGAVASAQEAPGVVVSPGSAAGRPPAVDREAEKAKAVAAIDALEEKYKALDSYHIVARKVSTIQRTRVEEQTSIWMKRPSEEGTHAHWRMELEIVRQLENTAPASIKTVNVSLEDESWTDSQAKGQHRVMRSLPNRWNSHFDVMRRGFAAHVNMVSVVGEEAVQGHAATVFQVVRGADMRRTIEKFWVCNETGLLLRETEEKEGRLDSAHYEVEKIEWNKPIAESVWEYTPPEGVAVIDLVENQQVPKPAQQPEAAPSPAPEAPDSEPATDLKP